MSEKSRCIWPGAIPIYVDYHGNEWGCPAQDNRQLFEKLILDGARQERYKRAVDLT